ncbi:MAG: hypothetical protein B7Z72_05730 [Gemmatimonadetes bacterium 21-71-4]|nr:MAG: hypothetical protein B7Z72_05730 [Gemmatimonadetes bacterium 21-71-4]
MPLLWSSLVVAGLLVLVYLMIAGVPQPRRSVDAPALRTPRLLLPMVGALCTALGIAGYLTDGSRFSGPARWAVVLLAGAAAALLMAGLVVKVFSAPSSDPEDDPRYRFQGHVARVTKPIAADRLGRIVFEIDGHRFDLPARAVDNAPMPADTEVVIEQVDGEVATVELWSVVEQRL